MPLNPSPEVQIARDAAKKLGADRCIVTYTMPDGRIGYASYGVDRERCENAQKLADVMYDAAEKFLT